MPDPARLLNTIHQAIQAYQATPGRQGHLIDLSDATEVLVAGDMHGSVENLRSLLKLADLGTYPQRHLVLQEVIHGPHRYPTGGDKSHQLLDLTIALKCQFPKQFHLLPGNHELAQWTGRVIGKEDWDLNQIFKEGVETAYGSAALDVCAAYDKLFAALPLALRTPNRVFLSHSLPSSSRLGTFDLSVLAQDELPQKELHPGGSAFSLVWGRDLREDHVLAFLTIVDADFLISGHVPCDDGFDVPNPRQIILDSQGYPAAYCLFPTTEPMTLEDLVSCVSLL